jgi:hypothetical protein
MRSIFEMAVALSNYQRKTINAAHAASVITANLSSLDGVEFSELRKLVQSVGFSLADIEWTGSSPDFEIKVEQLQCRLSQLIAEKTTVVDVPDYLTGEYQPQRLLCAGLEISSTYELRQESSSGEFFLCQRDLTGHLIDTRRFRCIDDLEEAIWTSPL